MRLLTLGKVDVKNAPRRPMPRWREAELYFKRERDRKLPVTLPRVRWLEAEPEQDPAQ
jgi:hypothetical protein